MDELSHLVINCLRCPRLREYCQRVAQVKRRAYIHQEYWGKPVPGWGDPKAKLVIVGLAPGAHGSNRTGRMFTGDRSGDFLYAALFEAGFCNKPYAVSRSDGLELRDVYITAVARCAPPGNKPLAEELDNCRPFLIKELQLLSSAKVILALGKIAFDGVLRAVSVITEKRMQRPSFIHGAFYPIGRYILVASYHVSQQNTQTGRLTYKMFDTVLSVCKSFMN